MLVPSCGQRHLKIANEFTRLRQRRETVNAFLCWGGGCPSVLGGKNGIGQLLIPPSGWLR